MSQSKRNTARHGQATGRHKKAAKDVTTHPLCYRCEHRVKFFETEGQHRPRFECGAAPNAVCCCYMYQPVAPVTVRRAEGEKRPPFIGWMLAGRVVGVRVAKTRLKIKETSRTLIAYHEPQAIGRQRSETKGQT